MNLTQMVQGITAVFLMLGLGCTLAIGDDATNINLSGSASEIAASGFVGLQNNVRSHRPVHLLLPDADKTEQGVFIITNGASDPVYMHFEAYDATGALLLVDYFHVDGEASRRVAWTDLPPGSVSVVVLLDNPEEKLHVQVPAGSSLVLAPAPIREQRLKADASSASNIVLYNPKEEVVAVDLMGETSETFVLWPHELRSVRITPRSDAIDLRSVQQVVAMSAPLSDLSNGALAFGPPTSNQRLTQGFNAYFYCNPVECGKEISGYHSGVDLGPLTARVDGDPIAAVGLGKIELAQRDTGGGWGNYLVVRHLMESGDVYYSSFAHLQGDSFAVTTGDQVVKGKTLANMGSTGVGTATHLHFQVRKNNPQMGRGYYHTSMDTIREGFECPQNDGCPSGNGFTGGAFGKPLIPYFSRSSATPSATNYDIYGIVGSTLYSALPLRPSTQKTFNSVGVGGQTYQTSNPADSFLCATATLTSTSASLTRTSSACTQPTGNTTFAEGDYRFYAQSNEFEQGYNIKFSVVPQNSEVIDNDGRLVDASGNNTTANRLGYFTSSELNALDVPGYFVTAKLFAAGGSNLARWFPQNGRTYAIWVHVPRGSTATNVRYKVYPRGRPSDGSCSSINTTNPCFMTDAISHLANQDRWVRLVSGTVNRFAFVASSTNGGFVGLEGDWIVGGNAGVDAVKFIGPETFSTCNTITPENFYQPAYNNYGAPFDLFLGNAMSVDAKCSSSDKHTIKATLGIPGNTTRLVYMMGYYYDHSISGWKKYTPTCNGTINGDWCVGSATANITDPNISTDSASAPTYFVGYVCSWQNGQWKCGCRDTACAKNYWQLQGARR